MRLNEPESATPHTCMITAASTACPGKARLARTPGRTAGLAAITCSAASGPAAKLPVPPSHQ